MADIRLEAGEFTEEVTQFLLENLDSATVDTISVSRDFEVTTGLASEPITSVVLISGSIAVVLGIIRLIERYLETQRQITTLTLVANGFSQSDEAGIQLAALAKKHAEVAISYDLLKIAPTKQPR